MRLPMDLNTAKKLRDKGYLSDNNYSKVENLHKNFEKVAVKLAGGGNSMIPDDPNQWKGLVDQGIITPETYDQAKSIISQENAVKEYNTLKSRNSGMTMMGIPGGPTFSDEEIKDQAAKGLVGQAKSVLQKAYDEKMQRDRDLAVAKRDEAAATDILGKTGAQAQPTAQQANYPVHGAYDVPTQGDIQKVGMGQLASDKLDVPQQPAIEPFDYSKINTPFEDEKRALQEQVDVANAKGDEIANQNLIAQQKMLDTQEQMMKNAHESNTYAANAIAEMRARNEELSKTEIDPTRFWHNASTEQKLLAGIGLFLGSYGSGGNKAVPIMEDAVKRDVDSQVANLENKRSGLRNQNSLFAENMAIYKNKDQAYAATMSQALSNYQMKVGEIAGRYSGPEAQAKAKLLAADIDQKKNNWDMQLYNMKAQQYAAQHPEQYKEMLPPEKRERLVTGYSGYANSKEQAKEAGELASTAKSASNTIDRLIQISKTGDKTDPATRAEASTLSQMLIGQLRAPLFGPGAFSESEQAIAHDIIKNPTAIFALDASTLSSLNTLKSKIQDMADTKARSAGVIPVREEMGLKKKDEAPKPYTGGMLKTGYKK